jgi:hypothetical protein
MKTETSEVGDGMILRWFNRSQPMRQTDPSVCVWWAMMWFESFVHMDEKRDVDSISSTTSSSIQKKSLTVVSLSHFQLARESKAMSCLFLRVLKDHRSIQAWDHEHIRSGVRKLWMLQLGMMVSCSDGKRYCRHSFCLDYQNVAWKRSMVCNNHFQLVLIIIIINNIIIIIYHYYY